MIVSVNFRPLVYQQLKQECFKEGLFAKELGRDRNVLYSLYKMMIIFDWITTAMVMFPVFFLGVFYSSCHVPCVCST